VKVGDLVKYKIAFEHLQHLVGLVVSVKNSILGLDKAIKVSVLWNRERPQGNTGTPMKEWVCDIEVINESR